MQRRPSHPHGQLTGLIVIVSLMVSVAVMFWLPSQPQHTPALAAAGEAPTPALPSAPDTTRTPRIEQGPEANGGVPVPTMDWASVPTAVPAEQLIQPTAEIVYVAGPVQPAAPAPPPDNSALIAAQQALADAQALAQQLADSRQQLADAAFESQRQAEARHQAELQAAQTAVNASDFTSPDPKARCQFVGCL